MGEADLFEERNRPPRRESSRAFAGRAGYKCHPCADGGLTRYMFDLLRFVSGAATKVPAI